MRKYVLLGILALLLVAIPLAVAADTSDLVTLNGPVASTIGIALTDHTLNFGSSPMIIGNNYVRTLVTVSVTNAPTESWKITVKDNGAPTGGHMGTGPSLNYELIQPMRVGDAGNPVPSPNGCADVAVGYTDMNGATGVTFRTGSIGNLQTNACFKQVVQSDDQPGAYGLNAAFYVEFIV